jgi:tetratricopeptide (TPR) repeat protein
MGDFNSALEDANKCIELDSNFTKGYYRLACAYFEKREYDKAMETIKDYDETEFNIIKEKIIKKKEEEQINIKCK